MAIIGEASKINGIPEVIDEKIDGILLPKENVGAIADAMLKFNHEKEKLGDLEKKAYQKIRDYFSFE